MISIGLSEQQKQQTITDYLAHHDITRVVVFAPKAFPFVVVDVPAGIVLQPFDYTDIIMYKVFYPLLEVIDERTLLIFHECLRTQNRNDLTYNCAHHYAHQTPHVLVFQQFPLIEQPEDFMILLDYQTPGKYKSRGFDTSLLAIEDIQCVPHHFSVEVVDAPIAAQDRARYEQKKEQLFAGLGQGDPDTIPRQLHLFAGNLKRGAIQPDRQYVARNTRFKLPNVTSYKDIERASGGDYTVIDFPHRRIEFNDFLARTGLTTIRFLSTGLKVDEYYLGELGQWIERLERMYADHAQTGL